MRLIGPAAPSATIAPLPPSLWPALKRIQTVMHLDDSTMAGFMRLTRAEFLRLRETATEPGIRSMLSLAEAIQVGFDTLVTGRLDYGLLARRHDGPLTALPEKYGIGATSRRSTVINHLKFIEQTLGWERKLRILRDFQMTESMLADPQETINLRLSVDIGDWILNHYGNEEILLEMGRHAVRTHRNGPMGDEMRKARNLRELFEIMFTQVVQKYVEKNFLWSIEALTPRACVVRGVPNWDLLPTLGTSYVRSHVGCLLRTGFASSIPCYLGYPAVQVRKSHCVARGDDFCRFEFDLEPIALNWPYRLVHRTSLV